MFVGRTAEMSELNRLYGTDSFEMPVIYGRRRVGKTRLITEFIKARRLFTFKLVVPMRRQTCTALARRYLQARLVLQACRFVVLTKRSMHWPPWLARNVWLS